MPSRAELDRKFIAAVERLGRALRAARQDVATELQISLLQLQVVEHLSELGARRVGVLSDELDVTQPTVSDTLATLEGKGIVQREPDSTDRRATVVSLSEAGTALAQQVQERLTPILEHERSVREADQATALHVILSEILRLQEAGVITINRSCLSCDHFQAPAERTAGRCLLLRTDITRSDLRVDCADHQRTAS